MIASQGEKVTCGELRWAWSSRGFSCNIWSQCE